MAKFNSLSLYLLDNESVYFGTGDDTRLWHDGSEMRISTTISGVDPTQDYHLTTKWYVDDAVATVSGGGISDHGLLSGLGDDDHPHYTLADGTRPFTGTVSGVTPTVDAHLTTKQYVDGAITTATGALSWPTAHNELTGLDADDHTHYTLADGTRAFTGTVSGITPTVDAHLTTKQYVDDAITTATGSLTTDHGELTGLSDDDHTHYTLADGTRAFTGTVSGIDPVVDEHLATKGYVDAISYDVIKSGREVMALGDYSKAITFGAAFADESYSASVSLTYSGAGEPSIYPYTISSKTNAGFTLYFSGKMDSNDYVIDWIAHYDL